MRGQFSSSNSAESRAVTLTSTRRSVNIGQFNLLFLVYGRDKLLFFESAKFTSRRLWKRDIPFYGVMWWCYNWVVCWSKFNWWSNVGLRCWDKTSKLLRIALYNQRMFLVWGAYFFLSKIKHILCLLNRCAKLSRCLICQNYDCSLWKLYFSILFK